ncbi:hypothetical protein LOK49_LG08G02280 [Camellia lanceoleosa]|uniref:Uncharacterized protein n=1 Tax=Camellia lanceoleosa TaxID=1840588 RepID=A0ACC0GP22_9ERIC|nr:hypothetical protein LOK49_LG08G02280 [Camellia lanceoleosa]
MGGGGGNGDGDPLIPLLKLPTIGARMDYPDFVNSNTLIGKHQMGMVFSKISSATLWICLNVSPLRSTTKKERKNGLPSPSRLFPSRSPNSTSIGRIPETVCSSSGGENKTYPPASRISSWR